MTVLKNLKAVGSMELLSLKLPGEGQESALLAIPADRPVSGLVVSVHGISRNAEEHAMVVGQAAANLGWATVAPIFDHSRFPGYQRLGNRLGKGRSDLALDAMVDSACDRLRLTNCKFFLCGFSGGAQFAHRYALLYPQHVRAVGLCAAGWYTRLNGARAFPNGTRPVKRLERRPCQVSSFLSIPLHLSVGENDVAKDPALRSDKRIDKIQGVNRVERAQAWFDHLNRRRERLNISTNTQFETLPRTGHDFSEAVDPGRGDLAAKWAEFFSASAARGR